MGFLSLLKKINLSAAVHTVFVPGSCKNEFWGGRSLLTSLVEQVRCSFTVTFLCSKPVVLIDPGIVEQKRYAKHQRIVRFIVFGLTPLLAIIFWVQLR